MRLTVPSLVLAVAIAGAADVPYGDRAETEHFVFAWAPGAIDEEGLAYGKRQAESFYGALVERLGESPPDRIAVLLHGPAERPDGSWGYPRVDSRGRIHLYRFGPTYHGYFGALPHEMVHAFRIDRNPHHDWFFEEGFAELVALRAGKSLEGFPWYGAPVEIAAGQWLARGEGIPLGVLRERHRDLNLACRAQSYALRSSFFLYLGDTYGDAPLLEMAAGETAGNLADYERLLGKPFEALAADWRAWLLGAFRGRDDAEARARRYRDETPIRSMDVCREGEQF
jgi:hypothetical protein